MTGATRCAVLCGKSLSNLNCDAWVSVKQQASKEAKQQRNTKRNQARLSYRIAAMHPRRGGVYAKGG